MGVLVETGRYLKSVAAKSIGLDVYREEMARWKDLPRETRPTFEEWENHSMQRAANYILCPISLRRRESLWENPAKLLLTMPADAILTIGSALVLKPVFNALFFICEDIATGLGRHLKIPGLPAPGSAI